jgi:hypothetical protein
LKAEKFIVLFFAKLLQFLGEKNSYPEKHKSKALWIKDSTPAKLN